MFAGELVKKRKKPGTHFTSTFLRRPKESQKLDGVKIPADDQHDLQQCSYCGIAILASDGQIKTYSGDLSCKLCTSNIIMKDNDEVDLKKFYIQCETFLGNMTLDEPETEYLELATRTQSLNQKWKEERKFRVTSSFFGRICRVRDFSSFENIVKTIRESKQLKTPAIIHGIECENRGREEYIRRTNSPCKMVGLIVHKIYPFLAASPDGLVGDDGLVEIKCPFNARYRDPKSYKFNFLTPDGSSIRLIHNYHYQIQGLLEITDRSWCDLVVYTYQDIKIVRVFRNNFS